MVDLEMPTSKALKLVCVLSGELMKLYACNASPSYVNLCSIFDSFVHPVRDLKRLSILSQLAALMLM